MSVRIRAKLPKGDTNGLAPWERSLADDPDLVIPVVALVQADTVELKPHDTDDGQLVKCVILGIEGLTPTDADGKTVDGLLRQIYQARTGRLTLPFEEGDDGE